MRRGRALVAAIAAVAVTALGAVGGVPPASAQTPGVKILSSHPLVTAVYLDRADVATSPVAYSRVADAGATVVRFTLYWAQVAPASKPASWNPSDPADPNYNWGTFDQQIQQAVAHGLEPLVTLMAAPLWAQQSPPAADFLNSRLPDPKAFGQFATAVATRYSGTFQGLPRVRFWQAWNEPNISLYLIPQLVNGQPVSPAWYRKLLNSFADAVHAVHSDNVIIAAGLAPFRDITQEVVDQDKDWGPLSFMRSLLCLSASLKPTCADPVKFDIWAAHPYTSGGPTHHAVLPNDVSLGDLPKVQQTLAAAVRAGHVRSRGPVGLWVTEFSWDTNPPDPKGVPAMLARRWVAEGLYRMWTNGVSLVTWLMLRDDPLSSSFLQSGLYYQGSTLAADRPKPLLAAFRFPVVGLRAAGSGVYVWGRTPAGIQGSVIVERRTSGPWRRLGTLQADAYGIFQSIYQVPYSGYVRARLVGQTASSPPFALADVPDQFFNPFGEDTLLEPPKK